ncbi:MAG: heme A synthase [Rhizobiales bacterium]|nr:heme A synthase [Hyphomicrobiales bacterium]
MSVAHSEPHPRRRFVRAWLLIVAALVFATAALGGATRLTGSGLSIVEWRPVMGALPPLSDEAWHAEFAKYKTIPQYQEVNRGMSLEAFKVIYWWEWGHRLLGRVIGVAFLLPFLWFLWKGWIEPGLRLRLWTIFGLGALQGAVGWWMVTSGLAERLSVSPYRLAFHLTLACTIFAMLLWTAQRLKPRDGIDLPPRIRTRAMLLLILVLAQIYLGALVAGSRAGLIYNTWPLIDGALVPDVSRLFFERPWWRNFFENTLLVQFNHRMLAYAIFALAILHTANVARASRGGAALTGALVLASLITLQAGIGILTLLHVVPLGLALLHQAMAVVTLAVAVIHAERVSQRRAATADIMRPLLSS